jgi:hypothetical protein
VDYPIKPFANSAQHFQPIMPVIVAQKNTFPTIATRGYVIKRSGKFES